MPYQIQLFLVWYCFYLLADLRLLTKMRERERESNSTKSSITNARQNLAQNQYKQAHQKSSGFIGFELGFGLANTKISQNHQNLLSDKTYATLPLNLSFGYLWYFSRSMGLRFSGFIGTSSYSNEMLKTQWQRCRQNGKWHRWLL